MWLKFFDASSTPHHASPRMQDWDSCGGSRESAAFKLARGFPAGLRAIRTFGTASEPCAGQRWLLPFWPGAEREREGGSTKCTCFCDLRGGLCRQCAWRWKQLQCLRQRDEHHPWTVFVQKQIGLFLYVNISISIFFFLSVFARLWCWVRKWRRAGAGTLAVPIAMSSAGPSPRAVSAWLYVAVEAVKKAKKAGLVFYELITLFVVAVNFTTVNWLATVSDHLPKGTPRNYEGISRKYLGAGASHVISLVFIFGSLALGMSYMLFTAQSLAPILAGWMSPSHELPSESEVSHLSRILLWVLGLGVVLPLSLLRDISKLKFTSTLAIFALAYAAGFIVFSNLDALAAQPRAGEGFQLVNVHSDFFLSLAMTTSNFSCHISAIPIYESLASRNASTMKRVVALALGTSALFYQVVGLTSYCRFGRLEAGQGNILEVVAERISLLETPLRFALEPQMSE